jgi:hypothetical protein
MFNRMKIVRGPDAIGSTDWSPTVVHIERMKRRRTRRIMMMAVLICAGIGLCLAGASLAWYVKGL